MPISNPGVRGPRTIWAIATGGQTPFAHLEYRTFEINAVGEYACVTFDVPEDFNSIYKAVLILFALATQAEAAWTLDSMYCGIGEAGNIHDETDAVSTYNVVNGKKCEIDISGVLSELAAGDTVSITIRQRTIGHDAAIVGVRFSYE